MVFYEELLEDTIGVQLTPIDENVFLNKTKIDSIIKDILGSYSDNGIATNKNGKVKLSLKGSRLERNIYTGYIKWTNALDGGKYFKSIINKIKSAIKTEGFHNIKLSDDGKLSIELTRADNNRIKNSAKRNVIDTTTAAGGIVTKAAIGI